MKFLALFLIVCLAGVLAAPPPQQDAAPYLFDLSPDGTFVYNYQGEGSEGQAQGSPKSLPGNPPEIAEVITGSYSWKSPEGKTIKVTYTADETGYHPKVSVS